MRKLSLCFLLLLVGCGNGGNSTPSPPPTVVFLGDSLTIGYSQPPGVITFPTLIPGIDSVNRGVGGDTSAEMLARLPQCFVPKIKTLVFEGGLNDMGQSVSPDDFAEHVRQIVSECHSHGITVVLCTLTPYKGRPDRPINPAYEPARLAYNASLRQIATESGCLLADLNDAFLHGGEDLLGQDGEHPTQKGQNLIAHTLEPLLH